ncbi:MAG TPA: response regulator [Burkholderiales bacterium]|nr:response regulator [Burkholderiales bacterium]
MPRQDHILVVDDDAEIRALLREYLQKQEYRVTAVADGKGMRAAIETSRPDVIVLDLMMPGEDGLALCRDLRARSEIPIIMLTARGDETDRIVGLEMGADDYLAKPFNPRELLARIKSVLRRARSLPENLKTPEIVSYKFSGWTLDIATRNLAAPDRVVIPLSGTEFRLLRVFLDHPNRVLTRDQLIDLMLSRDAAPFDRAIDVQVSRLRYRLRDDAKEPTIIKTVRGQGYVFATPVEAHPRAADERR